jgi:hypothetical protein
LPNFLPLGVGQAVETRRPDARRPDACQESKHDGSVPDQSFHGDCPFFYARPAGESRQTRAGFMKYP